MTALAYEIDKPPLGTMRVEVYDGDDATTAASDSNVLIEGGGTWKDTATGMTTQIIKPYSVSEAREVWGNMQRYYKIATNSATSDTDTTWCDYYPTTAKSIIVKYGLKEATTTYGQTGWQHWICDGTSSTTYEWNAYQDVWYDCYDGEIKSGWERQTPQQRLAQILKQRQSPFLHAKSKTRAVSHGDEREMRARETLRMIVGEEKFQRFIRRGFVTAYNRKSGYTYQIFHSSHHLTHVWKNGKMVQRLCIYLKGNFPPTDFVITMYLLAINNDDRIWQVGVKNPPLPATEREEKLIEEPKSLVEIFNELKGVA